MAVVDFSNVEYRFRYGRKADLDATSIRERSFNIAYDTGELFVDIMNRRVPINSKLIAMDYEDQIRALVDPEEYIYYAKDTCNLLYYHGLEEGWKICNREEVIFSREAEKDKEGNVITEHYASKEELSAAIDELRAALANLNRFESVIVDDYDSLPDPGELDTLYFVPDHEVLDPITGETITYYAQYVWVYNHEADMHYYEKIGVTTPDMKEYYTMIQIDQIIGNLDFGEEKDDVTVIDTTLRVLMPDVNMLPKVGQDQALYYVSRVATNTDTGVSQIVYDKYDWVAPSYEFLGTVNREISMRNNLVVLENSVSEFPATGDVATVYAVNKVSYPTASSTVTTYADLPTTGATDGDIIEVTETWTNEETSMTYPAGIYQYSDSYSEWVLHQGTKSYDKYLWQMTKAADDVAGTPAEYDYVFIQNYSDITSDILS